ncbi:MAG: response regulator [Anaerolineae bacterium]|nr:response regulator [Anaerolineae bacterium]
MHVLIIDDDPHIAENVKEMLELEGHTARVATTVEDGVRLVQETPPDVVLCDWRLPDGTGADVIGQLPDVPVILTTGTDVYTIEQIYLNQAAGYIMKPFRMAELVDVVTQVAAAHL